MLGRQTKNILFSFQNLTQDPNVVDQNTQVGIMADRYIGVAYYLKVTVLDFTLYHNENFTSIFTVTSA